MPSSSFRLISTAISILLLAALASVVLLAVRDNPTTALVRPTATVATARASATPTPTPAATDSDDSTPVTIPDTSDAPEAPDTPETTATDTPTTSATATLPPTPIPPTATDVPSGSTLTIPDAPSPTPEPTRIASPYAAADFAPTVRVYSNGNYVNAVAVTRSTVWSATNGGVVAWNKTSGGYVKFTTADGLSINRAVSAAVCPLPGLGVIFGSAAGLQIFDTQTGSWKTLDPSNSPMRGRDVVALWCDAAAAQVVVAYGRDGLDLFSAQTGAWQPLGVDALANDIIRDMAVSPDGETLWLATANGLVALSGGEATRFNVDNSPLTDNRIEALAVDGSGAVWLTSGDTLYRTANDEWDAYNGGVRGNFPNGRLTGLDVSDDGAIWIGSDQAQLCRFDPGVQGCVAFYSGETGMSTAPLTSLTIGTDGEVFYTTAGGGISHFDGTTWRPFVVSDEPIPGNAIRTLTADANGDIWVAANGGAGRISAAGTEAALRFVAGESPLPSVDIRAVLPLGGNRVWIGGSGGVAARDGDTWTRYTPDDGLAGATVTTLTADGQNRIWVGTTEGLSIWTGAGFFNLTTANGLPSNDITALQGNGDVVWIGTRGGGLLRFQSNQLQLFNAGNSNLPNNTITALDLAADGSLYIGTEAGVAHFRDNELVGDAGLGLIAITAVAAAPSGEAWAATTTQELYRYDGVAWQPFDAPSRPDSVMTALLVDPEGDLWIGGAQGGVVRYTP